MWSQVDTAVIQRRPCPSSVTWSAAGRLHNTASDDDENSEDTRGCYCSNRSSTKPITDTVCRCQLDRRIGAVSTSCYRPMTSLVTWRRCKTSRCRTTEGLGTAVVRTFSNIQESTAVCRLGSTPKSTLSTDFRCTVSRRSSSSSALTLLIWCLWCLLTWLPCIQSVPLTYELMSDYRVFRGSPGTSLVPFFHTLRVDAHNESVIYVGAIDHVYRLNAENISQFQKSENLTGNSYYISDYVKQQSACMRIGDLQNSDIQCRNHIRAVIPLVNSSQLYICSTGAYSPQEFILSIDTMTVLEVRSFASGRAKCPYDPLSIYSFAYVESGNPHNIPSLYTAVATDSNSGYVGLIRPELQLNRSKIVNLLRTDPDPKWINTAESVYVVAAFDIDQYVYYFFRELAIESTAYCGKTYYSRVARVCKNDEGGIGLTMEYRFTSFLKARLVCSVATPANSIPYYFNDIHDVKYNASSRTFYGLFMANSNGQWGSAVCTYHLDNVNKVFDHGAWIEQSKLESAWLRVPDEDVPRPRPGQCTGGSAIYITSTLSFIKSHPLMMDYVNADNSSPVYYSKEMSFNRLEVDVVRDYIVLYLYLQEVQELHRIVLWSAVDRLRNFSPISVWKPFASISRAHPQSSLSAVWSLTLHSVKQKKWLYVTGSEAVVQLSPSQCKSYEYCSDCVRDPYCGWYEGHCDTYQPGYLQAVTSADPVSVCGNRCTKHYQRTGVIPGMAIEMNCSSNCRLDNRLEVTWFFSASPGGKSIPVDVSSSTYAQTTNGGLIILRVSAVEHIGTYQCRHKATILTEHKLTASVCEFSENVRDTFTREYETWCKALDNYYKDYKTWTCMKTKCLQSNCIPKVNTCD